MILHQLAKRLLLSVLLLGSVSSVEAQTDNKQGAALTKVGDLVVATIVADDTSQTMGDLVDVLKKERAKGPNLLVVRVGGIEITVSPEPRKDNELPVHPNPLFLLVSVDAERNLNLNRETLGNLADLSVFTKRLGEILKDRAENGVFRPGTNEVEKTVSLTLDSMLKVGDLNKIVSVMDAAGSEPIILLIDPPVAVVDARRPLIPSTPKKPKKRNR